eukprot:6188664-Pleurochrysis_carterae.AAC.1
MCSAEYWQIICCGCSDSRTRYVLASTGATPRSLERNAAEAVRTRASSSARCHDFLLAQRPGLHCVALRDAVVAAHSVGLVLSGHLHFALSCAASYHAHCALKPTR